MSLAFDDAYRVSWESWPHHLDAKMCNELGSRFKCKNSFTAKFAVTFFALLLVSICNFQYCNNEPKFCHEYCDLTQLVCCGRHALSSVGYMLAREVAHRIHIA